VDLLRTDDGEDGFCAIMDKYDYEMCIDSEVFS
jgi:hypothetical protein